jgi:AAA15 family ATPase/GTPase
VVEADIGVKNNFVYLISFMDYNHLQSFKIENFKKFDNLEVHDIGKYNLIIGDNNVGKTTLLEALLMNNNLLETIGNLIACASWRKISYTNINANPLESFFDSEKDSINYSFTTGEKNYNLKFSTVESSKLDKETQDELNLKNIGKPPYKFAAELNNNNLNHKEIEFVNFGSIDIRYCPFIHYNLGFEKDLVGFYSDLLKENKNNKSDILKNLKLFLPDIENIEISSETDLTTTFLITLSNSIKPLIINNFGDGTIKAFRYILEIMKSRQQRLMIDEIDTGIHFSRMKNFFKSILLLSFENNVQLFTTTHSKECIDNFVLAVEETKMQEHARIIKLAQTKSGIKAYTMGFEEFSTALSAESEIR